MKVNDIRQNLIDYINVESYKIDMLHIYHTAEVISDITGLVLGIIAYSIAIFMTLITAVDICYITIPIFRQGIQRIRWDGTNERNFSAVSKDAINAVGESYTSCLNRSAISIYLGSRLISYIIAVFVLFLILGGIGYIQNIVEVIVRALLMATMGI